MRFFILPALFLAMSLPSNTWEPTKKAKSVEEIVTKLKARGLKVQQVPVKDRNVKALAGLYDHDSGFSGSKFYLFSDSTYIYTRWTDVVPETIYGKGTWAVKDGFIVLKSDGSLPGVADAFRDYHYAPLLMKDANGGMLKNGDDNRVFLLGHSWEYSYFLDHAEKSGDLTMFETCTFDRKEKFSKAEEEKLRKRLMKKAWRPDYFKDESEHKGKNEKDQKEK